MSEPECYLLNTSAVIDLPSPAQITPDAEYLISSITLAELNAGIHAATSPLQQADFAYLSPLLILVGLDDC